MQDAINQVKNDLGRDAVILHTRRLRKGGFFGFFAKEQFEVMAALDDLPKIAVNQVNPSYFPSAPATAKPLSVPDNQGILALRQDMSNLQKLMEHVVTVLPGTEPACSPLAELLIRNDIEPDAARVLTKGLPETIDESRLAIMKELLKERLSSCFQRVEVIKPVRGVCQIAAFIGPTGVGKTTTIAKLAANFSLKEGRRVALITADTYRIAALEQLKTYGDIIDVPLDIVYTPQELKAAIAHHSDKELILIDTAGRSPKNQQQLEELQALLTVEPSIQVYLVMSTTTKYTEAIEVVNRFSACSPSKFLFTKVDEAANIGTIVNLLHRFPVALSYITTGQNVPDDIEVADPRKLANLILRD
jgi:flagellar biosynthesis protein FlhF